MRDLKSNISPVASIAPAVLTATATGNAVDLLGFNSALVSILTGAIAGAGDFSPKLEESDDGTAFAAVATDDLIGTLPASLVAASSYEVGYRGHKRFIRPVITRNSGTSIAAVAAIIRGNPANMPT